MGSYLYIDGWKSNIRFSSAHIMPDYEKCGILHGHTFAVHAKVVGEPDKNGILVDFSILKGALKEVVDELDHRFLVSEKNKHVAIDRKDGKVKLISLGKEYIIPLRDCAVLPIESTSAENLARYILEKVMKKIKLSRNVESIEIGVDEGFGKGARVIKIMKGK